MVLLIVFVLQAHYATPNCQNSLVYHRHSTFDFLSSPPPTIGTICEKLTLDTIKLILMEFRSINGGRGSREAQTEYHLMSKMSCKRGTKLSVDAQRMAKGPSGQKPCQSLFSGREDYRNVAIRHMQIEMKEMRQVLVANN